MLSKEREVPRQFPDCNHGLLTSLCDRLGGSFRPSRDLEPEAPRPDKKWYQLTESFDQPEAEPHDAAAPTASARIADPAPLACSCSRFPLLCPCPASPIFPLLLPRGARSAAGHPEPLVGEPQIVQVPPVDSTVAYVSLVFVTLSWVHGFALVQ
ncbi:unnamed protein product [Prorocentrum cordatum]|uniref:Uncharacterized protein n=1 Tax=Prorocentrum cordatum TaxID=2364126 RepID=A0ABN9P858_9DINO|nr:unnamed protein product [Polarella glacialis]